MGATPEATAPGSERGRASVRTWQLDVAIVLGLGVLAIVSARPELTAAGGTVVVFVFVVLPLLGRRYWPLAVLAVTALGALATSQVSSEPWVQIASVGLASFTVGEREAHRARAALGVLAIAAAISVGFIAMDADAVEALAITFVVLVPTWILGDLVRGRRLDTDRRAAEAERALREREDQARAAAAEERRHVARELHDVVAHAVSVMVIQAGAARQIVRNDPDEAEAALLTVEATGREAMTELRRFLGALADEDEVAGVAPQPGIGELETLLDRIREAGLPASLEVAGTPRAIPPSLDVTVYRIVQEALTNALRYAERAATLVRLDWGADQLRLEILDDGPGTGEASGSGRGLVGMRQRASLVGGRLEAGPRLGGGYAVRAWLPFDPGSVAEAGGTG
jgi:signal transduction histidine kinase